MGKTRLWQYVRLCATVSFFPFVPKFLKGVQGGTFFKKFPPARSPKKSHQSKSKISQNLLIIFPICGMIYMYVKNSIF
jgi:hypothetical protein